MYKLILVDSTRHTFSKIIPTLQADRRVLLLQAESGIDALDTVTSRTCDLALVSDQLTDMTGLEFVRQLVVRHPFVNCALVSSMTDTAFHEATEGLGLLAKLPPKPDAIHTEELLQKLEAITTH